MSDLGTSFVASVARFPDMPAIVDGELRLSYEQWFAKISAAVALLDDLGLRPGDHLLSLLQNHWEAATLHWACQFTGVVFTPVGPRANPHDIEILIGSSNAKALAYEAMTSDAVHSADLLHTVRRIFVGQVRQPADTCFLSWMETKVSAAAPRVSADAASLIHYVPHNRSRPKGTRRSHRAELAAAQAHVAHNSYEIGERVLGVIPFCKPAGVHSLLGMSLVGGTLVFLPRFNAGLALQLIEAEKITSLYLNPALYHDLVHDYRLANTDVSSVRKLGYARAPMADSLVAKLKYAFEPDVFVAGERDDEPQYPVVARGAPPPRPSAQQ